MLRLFCFLPKREKEVGNLTRESWKMFQRDGRRDLRRSANAVGFLLLGIAVLFSFLPAGFMDLLVALGYRGSAVYSAYGNIEPLLYYVIQGSQFAVSVAGPSLVYLLVTRQPVRNMVPSQKVPPMAFVAMMVLGLGLSLFANFPSRFLVDNVTSLIPWQLGEISPGGEVPASATPFVMVLFVVRHSVFPAFFEEFLFRGIVIAQLRRFGEGFAIVASALLFGMFHGNLEQIPFAFLVGLVLGYMLVRTNNIWLCAAIHFLNNLVATISDLLEPYCTEEQSRLISGGIFALIFLLAAVGAVYLFLRHRPFFRVRFPWHPLSLGSRWGAFFSSIGIVLVLLMNLGETLWRMV